MIEYTPRKGDLLRVRDDAPNNTTALTPNWCKDMDCIRGTSVEVVSVFGGIIQARDCIGCIWNFAPEWLDPADPEKPLETAPTAETKRERHFQRFNVNDTIRMPHYDTVGKGAYRVWQIIGEHLGATHQEGTYALKPLDIEPNEPIHVPCLMLETHPEVEKL